MFLKALHSITFFLLFMRTTPVSHVDDVCDAIGLHDLAQLLFVLQQRQLIASEDVPYRHQTRLILRQLSVHAVDVASSES